MSAQPLPVPERGTGMSLPRQGDWVLRGRCAEVDADLWFPVKGDNANKAKAICKQQCPVLAQCADWAIRAGETEGIWGGMSPAERHEQRRRMGKVRRV